MNELLPIYTAPVTRVFRGGMFPLD